MTAKKEAWHLSKKKPGTSPEAKSRTSPAPRRAAPRQKEAWHLATSLAASPKGTTGNEMRDSTLWRSVLAVSAFGLFAILSAGLVLAFGTRIALLERVQAQTLVTREALVASDAYILLGSRLSVGLNLVCAVTFLLWLHRARANLAQFRSGPFEFSPSEAVVSFFIPIVNFVQPYFVVRELWRLSDPAYSATEPRRAAPKSPLVLSWWVLFIGRVVLGAIGMVQISNPQTVESFLTAARVTRVMYIVSLVDALLASALVWLIFTRQRRLLLKPSAVVA